MAEEMEIRGPYIVWEQADNSGGWTPTSYDTVEAVSTAIINRPFYGRRRLVTRFLIPAIYFDEE